MSLLCRHFSLTWASAAQLGPEPLSMRTSMTNLSRRQAPAVSDFYDIDTNDNFVKWTCSCYYCLYHLQCLALLLSVLLGSMQ